MGVLVYFPLLEDFCISLFSETHYINFHQEVAILYFQKPTSTFTGLLPTCHLCFLL